MKKDKNKNKTEPKENKTVVTKTLIITLPSLTVLFSLTILEEIDPYTAFLCYFFILFTSLAIMSNFFTDIQSLLDFTKKLSEDINTSSPKILAEGTESEEIIKAINNLRNIWSEKLQNNHGIALSDAAVLDSLPEPLIFTNETGYILGANLSARDLFGHNIRGKEIYRAIGNDGFKEKFKNLINMGINKDVFEISMPDPWQKNFFINITRLPAEAKGGANILISISDITMQKLAEQKQVDFFANASHELKTPLSVISGFVETLQTSAKDDMDMWNRSLRIIKTQADNMTQIIKDLLSISRIESDLNNEQSEYIKLLPILEDTTKTLFGKAKAKKMSFVNKVANHNASILSSKYKVKQLFQNLLDNAVKYGKEGSSITTEIKKIDKENILIRVHNDTDEAISKEQLQKITERFFRADSAKAKKIMGTGLGLSIVKSIVTAQGGSMEISSNIIEGTTFSIVLPS